MDDFKYKINNNNEIIITKYTGHDSKVIILSEIDDKPVTEIGDYAFKSCSSLTTVTIPDSVTNIGCGAFVGCSSLTSIEIPASVTSMGECAFSNCSSLTSITIPDSVTSIGKYAFDCCSSLTSVTIPDGVTNIGHYAFYDCDNLTTVTIPDSVKEIGYFAFNDCEKLQYIKCNPGSYAEQWANEHGYETEPIMSKLKLLLNKTNPATINIPSNQTFTRGDCNEL